MQNFSDVRVALRRISNYIVKTPILNLESLNTELGHNFFFKMESYQKSGAFKIRGIFNHLLDLYEKLNLPNKVVAYTTGNHGIGLSIASKILGIKSRIYIPKNVTYLKQKAILENDAELIVTDTRQEAEEFAREDSLKNGFYYLHPSSSDSTIAGAGTMCYEALLQLYEVGIVPDMVFASCGGGGLLSGSLLARDLFCAEDAFIHKSKIKIIGAEPAAANDAYISYKQGFIHRFKESPDTIADGLRTLGLTDKNFSYVSKIDDIILVNEEDIKLWTKKLNDLLPIKSEYSACISMASAAERVKAEPKRDKKYTILILLSGGNM